ncbi:MAG: oligosaccharide flippase family protein [Clostridiaceae bacterium]|nr:oligosaccharide flippase family protein [Clostridiaceae bacterium]
MLIITGISLFTVRIVLRTLGAEDYGINNVVGGIISMLSFFTGTMTSSSMRFFAYELGRDNLDQLNKYFNLTVLCYLGFSLMVLLLAETVGLWFLKTQMVIPENRLGSAKWVYQFSVFSFIIHLFVIPYNSIIIARERMNIYAYISVLQVVLKLSIVYLLVVFNFDKLKLYAILQFLVTIIVSIFYITYCRYKFKESRILLTWDRDMFLELLSFSGWSLFGALAGVIRNQGINILLNVFFNPIVNAARAIAFQVNNAINQFVTNFYQAVRPQITKQYSSGNKQGMMKLVFRSSRFCYYLVLFFAIPILIETPYILNFWLDHVPEYTILFTRLVIITTMIESISYPLMTAVSATGNIKFFQIVTGGLLILNLPISYFLLKLGYSPQTTMYVAIFISVASQASRILFMRLLHKMSVRKYIEEIIFIISIVTILSLIVPFLLYRVMEVSFGRLLIITLSSFTGNGVIIYLVGLTKGERKTIKAFLISKLQSYTK